MLVLTRRAQERSSYEEAAVTLSVPASAVATVIEVIVSSVRGSRGVRGGSIVGLAIDAPADVSITRADAVTRRPAPPPRVETLGQRVDVEAS